MTGSFVVSVASKTAECRKSLLPGSSHIGGLSEETCEESVADEGVLVSLMAAFGHGIGKESNLALLINDTRK